MIRPGVVLLLAAAAVTSCSSARPHATTDVRLSAAGFKAHVQTLDEPFAKTPLPIDVSAGAAQYDGFAASVQSLGVESSEIGERATLVSAIHACAAALRAHPDLGAAQPSDYQACFTVQKLIDAMPT